MPTIQVKDASGTTIYLSASSGAGTSGDPYIIAQPLLAGTNSVGTVGLNAGTNNIGDVDVLTIAAGDNNIGNVDIASALPAGTNNIGDVDVLSLPALPAGTNNIGDVDILTIAAGDNNIGNVDIASAIPAGTNNIGDVDIASALPAGTNAIGKLAANTGVDIGDVDVTSLPALASTVDTITAKIATDAIQNGTTALTPKYGIIDAAISGDNTIQTAVVGKKIRVLAMNLLVAGAVTVRIEDGTGGTAMTGQYQFGGQGEGIVLPFNPVGWFETSSGTLLNMELSAAISVDGSFVYVEV